MACRFAEPHGPIFLPMIIFDRGRTQESPTQDTDPEACYSGCNCNHKSFTVAQNL